MVANLHDRRVIRYGFGDDSDVCGLNLAFDNGTAVFDLHLRNEDLLVDDMRLPMLGEHNVSNSLAAIAVARHLGLDIAQIREALGVFRGVNRRFTHVGTVNGVDVIDDYAHHPVELAAALRAARQSTSGRVVAVHQPHRYTRLHSLFDDMCGCFGGADVVAISEVYAAGESPIEGADRDSLVSALRRFGHRNVHAFEGQAGFGDFVDAHTRPGDLLICLGAGSISAWAHDLVSGAD